MSTYINIGNQGFAVARRGEYVDKSELIAFVNSTLGTLRSCSCVSRSRRFGKSMAAKMLCAYYDHSCDSRELFRGLAIEQHATFEEHLNKYPVIFVDMTAFVTRFHSGQEIVDAVQSELKEDILSYYPSVQVKDSDDLMAVLLKITEATKEQFVFIIDEWDAVCREMKGDEASMKCYTNFLRRMFKDVNTDRVFAAVYMTGILPIKKYNTESALNNFWEYSMILPGRIARFFGFTKTEVEDLCRKYAMSMDEMEKWYDGYAIGSEASMFNPNSVMKAIYNGRCGSYWAATGSFSNIAQYISMNFDGLKDCIISMLGGEHCPVNCTSFQNDPNTVSNKDEVLTLLIHLGYLAYDADQQTCYIPNREVMGEMLNAVAANNWKVVMDAINRSKQLLHDTLAGREDAVAEAIEAVHDESTSILSYNNENSLSCVLSLAYYFARNDYIWHRELPAGKGVADIVLIPKQGVDSPALLLELKWNSTTLASIAQIKNKQYPRSIAAYNGRLLMVAINYDKTTKRHQCVIESMF